MKCKAIRALQLLLGLIFFSTGGAHDCGFDLVVEQVRAIGPGPWIQLITGAQLNGLREAMAKVRSAAANISPLQALHELKRAVDLLQPVIPGSEMAARNATMQRQLSPARTSANLMARRCAAL